ncbi:MAG TPA: glycosyltransferase family A protein [Gemmatimonadales bacterium]|nr:glycosyltransferase family A protein [Gemmatimonadales bacterium]
MSVVIPSFNARPWLGEAIQSVRGQTLPPDEIIVVDDGSTDGSVEAAREAGATQVLSDGTNRGPGGTRNRGIQAASGDLVAFLDADDRWLPDHLERSVACLERHPDTDIVFSGYRLFGESNLELPSRVESGRALDLSVELLDVNHVLQSAAVARRGALLAVGGYDEARRYGEDFELWLRLSMNSKFVSTGAITVEYRTHPAQVTARPARMYQGAWEARAIHVARMLERNPGDRGALHALLQRRWEADLQVAWRERDDEVLRTVLALDRFVPDSGPIAARWRRRLRLQRPAWRALAWVYDRVPILRRWTGRLRGAGGRGR